MSISIVLWPVKQGAGYPSEPLYLYDLPREVYERRSWVVRWRVARYQCRWPKATISAGHCYYDKKTGLDLEYNGLLSKLISAKAQVTKMENAIFKYELSYVATIFAPLPSHTDEWKAAQVKLAKKKLELEEAQAAVDTATSNA